MRIDPQTFCIVVGAICFTFGWLALFAGVEPERIIDVDDWRRWCTRIMGCSACAFILLLIMKVLELRNLKKEKEESNDDP